MNQDDLSIRLVNGRHWRLYWKSKLLKEVEYSDVRDVVLGKSTKQEIIKNMGLTTNQQKAQSSRPEKARGENRQ